MRARTTRIVAAVLLCGACSAAPPAPGAPRMVALTIADGTVRSADILQDVPPGTIRVVQNEDVTMRFASDESVTLHLHGYEVYANAQPGVAADLRFHARATGRFMLEAHGLGGEAATTIAYVEVRPR